MKQRFTFTQEQREAILKPLGEIVFVIRTVSGLTQQELADMIGESRDKIAKMEKGKVNYPLERLIRIFCKTGCINFLFLRNRPSVIEFRISLYTDSSMQKAVIRQYKDSLEEKINQIGITVNKLRSNLGKSQVDFSDMVKVSRLSIAKVESQRMNVSVLTFFQIVLFSDHHILFRIFISWNDWKAVAFRAPEHILSRKESRQWVAFSPISQARFILLSEQLQPSEQHFFSRWAYQYTSKVAGFERQHTGSHSLNKWHEDRFSFLFSDE